MKLADFDILVTYQRTWQLCYEARSLLLRRRFAQQLSPDQMYGVIK